MGVGLGVWPVADPPGVFNAGWVPHDTLLGQVTLFGPATVVELDAFADVIPTDTCLGMGG